MNGDFSQLNLEYLIQARDLVVSDRPQAGVVLGIPDAMTGILYELTPQLLTGITQIPHPLITLRRDAQWWSRLLVALKDGHPAEIATVIEQASLMVSTSAERS